MMTSEGTRRLSILLGALGVLGWLIIFTVLCLTEGLSTVGDIPLYGWGMIVGIALACFFIPFAIVRGIAWVVSGFRQDKTK